MRERPFEGLMVDLIRFTGVVAQVKVLGQPFIFAEPSNRT